jgi:nitroreductase
MAFDQAPAGDAAVTFIILGDLRAHERLDEILDRSVEAGVMSQRTAETWVRQASGIYSDDLMARDEAIRSATLAAANLMISASARGMVSAPMIGFDPKGLREEFEIDDRYLPVMLLAVGRPADGNAPRKSRLPVDDVLAFDRCRKF